MKAAQRLIRKVGAASAILAGSLLVAAALSVAGIWLLRFSQGRGDYPMRNAERGLIEKQWFLMDRGAWLLALRWWLVACVVVGLLVLASRKLANWPSWRLALLWVPPFVIAAALAATLSDGMDVIRPPGGYLREPGKVEFTGDGGYILWPFLALGLQIVVTAVALLRSMRGRATSGRWGIAHRAGVFALFAVCAWTIVLYQNVRIRWSYGNVLYILLPILALGLQIALAAVAVGRSIRKPPTSGRWDAAQRQGVFSLIAVGAWLIVYGSIVHPN